MSLLRWVEALWVDGLSALLRADRLALMIGLALGVGILLLVRASQVWRYRQAFGYSVYRADALRRSLLRWAGLAGLAVLGIAAVYVWRDLPARLGGDELAPPAALAGESQRLLIPRLGLDAPVVEAGFAGWQWDLSLLHERVGRLAGTSRPGQPGNAVLAGHVTLAEGGWGPFAGLSSLQRGDRVFVVEGMHTWAYEVVETRVVTPTDVSVAFVTPDTRLTLITCADWNEVAGAYSSRYVVIARRVP